ncbi:hypothetical protein [Streptomyces sp. NPDC058861]|uniref:hypothetical protein n=1 Tax=Streptomyces sp. NPDC058861 TaxID=3346653 RepID=UPI00367B92B9
MVSNKKNNPYTVVKDWEFDWWESPVYEKRGGEVDDGPQVFHVWAPNASDASDEADELAVALLGKEIATYLRAVAVLHTHAPLVNDTE